MSDLLFCLLPLLESSIIPAAPAPCEDLAQEWTVEAILPPAPIDPLEQFVTHNLWPCGDLDRDGRTDFSDFSLSRPDPASGLPGWHVVRFRDGIRIGSGFDLAVPAGTSGLYLQTTRLRLRSPLGIVLLLDGAPPMIQAYLQETGQLIGSIAQPPPPAPGIPPPANLDWVYAAGDVNMDGWDDAFYMTFSPPYGYCGLIDGASLSVTWQQYREDVYAPLDFIHGEPGPCPDLDSDGIPDFLFGDVVWNGIQFGHAVSAHSGVDGRQLWLRVATGPSESRSACGRDLDQDGTADLILHDFERMEAWSGATGAEIWQQDLSVLDAQFPPGWLAKSVSMPLLTASMDVAGSEVVVKVGYSYLTGLLTRLAQFDGATGALLGIADFPPDLEPWSADGFSTNGGQDIGLFPAGDVDRDGFQEYAAILDDPSATPPWVTSGSAHRVVFLGQRNLRMPEAARLGAVVPARLHVPSAPLLDYLLLASTRFDPAGGFTAQGWQTGLEEADPYFQRSWTTRVLRGTLDSQGRMQRNLRLPDPPSLVGQKLHFRALIGTAATGSVWTVSSLATLEVLP